ncbi:MAG: SDR family NAD(P)-dependent oxidoreductase [Pseudomonas sp.]
MSQALRIEGGTAVITGAASGIGMGLARHAAGLKMRLVLADINAQQLDSVAASLDTEVLALPVDVTDSAAVESLAAAAFDRFGQVDILFNNAGIVSTGLSWEISAARWQQEFDVNVRFIVNCILSFLTRILNANRPAHIVNTS